MDSAPTLPGDPLARAAILAASAKATRHRRHSAPLVPWLMADADARDIGRALANCSLRLHWQAVAAEGAEAEARMTAARCCNQRLCPFCEWRRCRVLRRRLLTGAEALVLEHPKLQPLMLTLTVRNVPVDGLRASLQQLHAGWHRMTLRAAFPSIYWYRRTEVTVSIPGAASVRTASAARKSQGTNHVRTTGEVTVHPHLHCLLFVRPSYWSRDYVRQGEWQETWRQCVGVDYAPVIDVRRAYARETDETGSGLPPSALMEASKYVTKAADLPALGPLVADFGREIRGVRMVGMSKALRRYVQDGEVSAAELVDSPVDCSAVGATELRAIADWSDSLQTYILTG